MLEYVLVYLTFASFCFFSIYCFSAEMNLRLDGGSFSKYLLDGFRLLVYDYFGLYCPWSWKVAKEYRLIDMRNYLGNGGMHYNQLGYITSVDCDNPEKQEMIARLAFVSRKRFWALGTFNLLAAPIMIVVAIIAAILIDVVAYLRIKSGA